MSEGMPRSRDERLNDVLGEIAAAHNCAMHGVWAKARDYLVSSLAALDLIRPEMEAEDARD